MIRAYVVEDTLDDEGGSTLILTGHGTDKGDRVCAGVSALWHTFTDGLERMAKENPKQLAFHKVTKKKATSRRK